MSNLGNFDHPVHLQLDPCGGAVAWTDREPDHTPLDPAHVLDISEQIWSTKRYGEMALNIVGLQTQRLHDRQLEGEVDGDVVVWSSVWSSPCYRLPCAATVGPASIPEVFASVGEQISCGRFLVPIALQTSPKISVGNEVRLAAIQPQPLTIESVRRAMEGDLGQCPLGGVFAKAYDTLAVAAGVRDGPLPKNQHFFEPDETWIAWGELMQAAKDRGLSWKIRQLMRSKIASLIAEQLETEKTTPPNGLEIEGECLFAYDWRGFGPDIGPPQFLRRESLAAVAADYRRNPSPFHSVTLSFLEEIAGVTLDVRGLNGTRRRKKRASHTPLGHDDSQPPDFGRAA